MLNIGRLAAGGEGYYLEAVASGVEDYYTGSGEAPGFWLTEAAGGLGLAGRVAPEDLRHVLAARHPETGEELPRTTRRRVPGFDLAFRAPKSVSLLYGLGDEATAVVVRDAHDQAVAAAIGYLERQAGFARRGRNGVERVPVGGLLSAAFRHRTSRAGDPLLHTHVLVANHGRCPDGQWRTLDARLPYSHAKTAGFLYQAALRDQLSRRLGVAWTPVRNGTAEVAGVPREVIEVFSQRRHCRRRIGEHGEVGKCHDALRGGQGRPGSATIASARCSASPARCVSANSSSNSSVFNFGRSRLFNRSAANTSRSWLPTRSNISCSSSRVSGRSKMSIAVA